MNSLPLHPAVVHMPLALSILMPLFAAGLAWAVWTGRVQPKTWLVVVALQALLVGSGFVAMNTGGAEEERVEAVVQERFLETHEELAEQFVWAAAGTLALAGLVLVLGTRAIAGGLAAAVVVATVVVAALGLRVGHAGGQLVYQHGAAGVYTSNGATAAEASTGVPTARRGPDRD